MSLLISIDRTLLGLPPLVLSGIDDANLLGVADYREPERVARVTYAPTSRHEHGDMPLAMSLAQSVLGFDVFPTAATESAARALHTELSNAITQGLEFPVTVTVGDAPAETWTCNPGFIAYPNGRTFVDLRDHNAIWSVSLPCYPVPVIA